MDNKLKIVDKYVRYLLAITAWVSLILILPLSNSEERKNLIRLGIFNFFIWIAMIIVFDEIPEIYSYTCGQIIGIYCIIKIITVIIRWVKKR